MNYWEECVREAFEDAGIQATDEQVSTVVSWAEGAHENHSMAHGSDQIPSHSQYEVERLTKELKAERAKVVCDECAGRGWTTDYGPVHSFSSDCIKCRGRGWM